MIIVQRSIFDWEQSEQQWIEVEAFKVDNHSEGPEKIRLLGIPKLRPVNNEKFDATKKAKRRSQPMIINQRITLQNHTSIISITFQIKY